MAIMINLAPDLYQSKVRDARRRHLATVASFSVVSVTIGVVVLLFLIIGVQKLRLASLQNDIKSIQGSIAAIPDLDKAVTAEQHLTSLGALYQQRQYASKFFGVLSSVSPSGLAISSLTFDATQRGLKATGKAKSYTLAAKLAKALEASNVGVGAGASADNQPYFTNVALGDISASQDGSVSFSLSATMSQEAANGKR